MRFRNEKEYQAFLASRKAKTTREMPEPQSDLGSKAKGSAKNEGRKKSDSKASYRIVIIARRLRDLDPDNITVKAEIDELVKAGILPGDSSKHVEAIEKRVERVRTMAEEETIIEIWKEQYGARRKTNIKI